MHDIKTGRDDRAGSGEAGGLESPEMVSFRVQTVASDLFLWSQRFDEPGGKWWCRRLTRWDFQIGYPGSQSHARSHPATRFL